MWPLIHRLGGTVIEAGRTRVHVLGKAGRVARAVAAFIIGTRISDRSSDAIPAKENEQQPPTGHTKLWSGTRRESAQVHGASHHQ